ncbi:hypothetical protein [Massilia soli]|uniref:Uncharacterized protein n=1 Tax=Massilia soli TaxID=2792854 RepID=A0ABS7SSI1_9BURK|nr:hypothetical protein [Massilia soli]MBZ2208909.1 hypothetical protein [Massilia soli]
MDSRLRGNDGFRLCRFGESVAHSKFGEGVIVNIEGSGGSNAPHGFPPARE